MQPRLRPLLLPATALALLAGLTSAQTFPASGATVTIDAAGTYTDFVIPASNPPGFVRITASGGRGGQATTGSANHCKSFGGRAAYLAATFNVGGGLLLPGGTLRYVVAERGPTLLDGVTSGIGAVNFSAVSPFPTVSLEVQFWMNSQNTTAPGADGVADACQGGDQVVRAGSPANPEALLPSAKGPELGGV